MDLDSLLFILLAFLTLHTGTILHTGPEALPNIEVTSIEVGPLVQTGSPMANNVDIISSAT